MSSDYSLGQFTKDTGWSLDGDLWWWSFDLIGVLRTSFLKDLEARLDV